MQLDPIELGRLAIMQGNPLRYIERRVESIELMDSYHYATTVTQQFTVPFHNDNKTPGVPLPSKNLLVSLGWYGKERHPDIHIKGSDGRDLPLLRRGEQGRVGAILFTVRWQQVFLGHLSEPALGEARLVWNIVQAAVEQVITSAPIGANLVIYRLKRYLEELADREDCAPDLKCTLLSILAKKEFWRSFQTWAYDRLLIARIPGVPGDSHVATVSYAERFRYQSYSSGDDRGTIRRFLGLLGLGYYELRRQIANVGHAASLWVIYTVPEGVEPVRCFWLSRSQQASSEPDDDNVSIGSTKVAVGKHFLMSNRAARSDSTFLDIQIAQSPAVGSATALALLLFLVSTLVYKAVPVNHGQGLAVSNLVTLGGLFAAAPAAILGALAYRDHPFVRYATRGPRVLMVALAVQAAVLAVIVGLRSPGQLTEVLAYILSIYSLGVAGLFGYMRFGPRWRKNGRSRKPLVVDRTSPDECRRKQVRDAVIWIAIWLVVVVIAARSQAALQREHIFEHFPGDVWRAWWSWFGL